MTSTIAIQDNISSFELANQIIENLSHLARPVQNLARELHNFSSSSSVSGTHEGTCGHRILFLSQATEESSSQLCSDINLLTRTYLELTSCNHSSWLPVYYEMLNDTICTQGIRGLVWAIGTQVLILIFALVLWVFGSTYRFSFLSTTPLQGSESTDRDFSLEYFVWSTEHNKQCMKPGCKISKPFF